MAPGGRSQQISLMSNYSAHSLKAAIQALQQEVDSAKLFVVFDQIRFELNLERFELLSKAAQVLKR
jgi:hypothetical protein